MQTPPWVFLCVCVRMRRLAWMQYGFSFQIGLAAAKQLTAQRLTTCWKLKRWICRSSLKYLHFQDPGAKIYFGAVMFEQFTNGNRLRWLSQRCELHMYHTLALGFPWAICIHASVFCWSLWYVASESGPAIDLWSVVKSIFYSSVFGRWLLCKLYTFGWCHHVIRCRHWEVSWNWLSDTRKTLWRLVEILGAFGESDEMCHLTLEKQQRLKEIWRGWTWTKFYSCCHTPNWNDTHGLIITKMWQLARFEVTGVALPRIQDISRAAGLVAALRQGGLTQDIRRW